VGCPLPRIPKEEARLRGRWPVSVRRLLSGFDRLSLDAPPVYRRRAAWRLCGADLSGSSHAPCSWALPMTWHATPSRRRESWHGAPSRQRRFTGSSCQSAVHGNIKCPGDRRPAMTTVAPLAMLRRIGGENCPVCGCHMPTFSARGAVEGGQVGIGAISSENRPESATEVDVVLHASRHRSQHQQREPENHEPPRPARPGTERPAYCQPTAQRRGAE